MQDRSSGSFNLGGPRRRLVSLTPDAASRPQVTYRSPDTVPVTIQKPISIESAPIAPQATVHQPAPKPLPTAADLAALSQPRLVPTKTVSAPQPPAPRAAIRVNDFTAPAPATPSPALDPIRIKQPIQSIPQPAAPVLQPAPAAKKPRRKASKAKILTKVAVIALVLGIGGASGFAKYGNPAAASDEVAEVQGATQEKSTIAGESTVDEATIAAHKVAADEPRKLTIEKLNITSRIFQSAAASKNELAPLETIYDMGWATGGAKPGSPGTVVLDGYVHGATKAGLLYDLKKIAVGDIIKIERGDGTLYSYKVVKTQTHDLVNMTANKMVEAVVPNAPALNIITRSGDVSKVGTRYLEQFIVYATQI
jgi:hypothetical protein